MIDKYMDKERKTKKTERGTERDKEKSRDRKNILCVFPHNTSRHKKYHQRQNAL